MFKMHDFVVKTLEGMVGNLPEFQVRKFALDWYTKGVLTDEDLMLVEKWYTPVVEPTPEPVEDEEVEEIKE